MCHRVCMSYSSIQGSRHVSQSRSRMLIGTLFFVLGMGAAGCGEADEDTVRNALPSTQTPPPGETPADDGEVIPPYVPPVVPPYVPPAPMTDPDGGLDPDEVDPEVDDPTTIPPDPMSEPPPMSGGAWTLNADSAPDCPAEPPPIPLLGGFCLGFYWPCGWTNASGQVYSCICDLVHYLCI